MDWVAALSYRLRTFVLVIVGVLAFSCGSDSSAEKLPSSTPAPTPAPAPKAVSHESVSASIGPEGGALEHPTGAKLVIPAGALASATTLTIIGVDAPSGDAVGAAILGQGFEMVPEGTVFAKPVEIVLPFDATRIPAGQSADAAQVYTAAKGSTKFDALATTIDLAAGRAHAETMHFSAFVCAQNTNPVFVTTKSPLAAGTAGTAYAVQLAATGGTPPYRWSITTGGAGLPPGVSLAQEGALAGTPATQGVFDFNVLVEDAGNNRVQKSFSISVSPQANPVPTIATLTPNSASQGANDTGVTVNGTGFVPSSVVTWNGTNLTTAYVSATQVRGVVTKALLATAGTAQIAVFSPAPGGGTSNSLTFTVNAVVQNPLPTVSSLDPNTGAAGDPDTQVVVNGTGFIAQSKAVIGVQQLSTLFISSTQLEAVIPASYLSTAGTLQVAVNNPTPGGGTSGTKPFTVGAVNPAPTLTSISPTSTTAGSATFAMTLTGTNFVNGGVVFFGPTALTTTVNSATSATAQVLAANVASAGSVQVTFVNPTPGGGASNAQTFSINAPVTAPTINDLKPTGARTASNDLTLWAQSNAPGLLPGAIIYVNGTPLGTIYTSPYSVHATIPAAMLSVATTLSVTVKNPGSSASNAVSFPVAASGNAIPAVTAVSPATTTLGSASSVAATITGTSFVKGNQQINTAFVYWRFAGEEAALPLTWYGGSDFTVNTVTSIAVMLQPALFATAGQHKLVVLNPAPGGGASNEFTFDVQGTNPVPNIASIAPAGPFGTGTGDVTLTLTGAMPGPSFVSRTIVTASSPAIGTTEIGRCGSHSNTCKVTLPARLMAEAGTLTITATSPAPGGGAGTTASISIVAGNPTPQITSYSPTSLTKNAAGQTVYINGTGFSGSTTVKELMSNTSIPITMQTNVSLQVSIPAALLDGTYANLQLEVSNPMPGGGPATTANMPVVAAPLITSTSPEPFAAATAFTMTISGTNLDLPGTASVHWDGAFGGGAKAPTTKSATQWTVDFSATDFPNAGEGNFWITIAGHPTSNFRTVTAQ